MDSRTRLRRQIGRVFLLAIPLLAVAAWQRDDLPPRRALLKAPQLQEAPRQEPTNLEPFWIAYRRSIYDIEPKAEYEVYGLIVSESDAGGLGDMYYDETSPNTKDVCMVWGENLTTGVYRRARFTSGSFTCYVQWYTGDSLRMDQVANHHLVVDSPVLQRKLRRLRAGDQVHVAGLLVDYRYPGSTEWRRTSLVRDDRLCEIVLVEEIEVLRSGNPLWRLLFRIAAIVVFAAPLVWLALVWVEAGRGGTTLGEL